MGRQQEQGCLQHVWAAVREMVLLNRGTIKQSQFIMCICVEDLLTQAATEIIRL